jgi:hypothetical protein
MLNDKCKNEKVPSLFGLRLGTRVEQSFTFALARSSKVPFGNNTNYIEVEAHKILPIHLCQDFRV